MCRVTACDPKMTVGLPTGYWVSVVMVTCYPKHLEWRTAEIEDRNQSYKWFVNG